MSASTRGRERFAKYKKLIILLSWFLMLLPKALRKKLWFSCRRIQGTKGLVIRYVLLKTLTKSCGDNVAINSDCFIYSVDKISLGRNVSIHPMCYIDATGEITIGNDVSIAHGVTIMSTEHNYSDFDVRIKDQGGCAMKTIIEDNVWIGARAVILAGTRVSSGSIVGAGAVVTKDVEENSIVAGIPAKVIMQRKPSE